MAGPMADTPSRPIERHDGYLPIADHGLLGDGAAAALVGRDGAVSWMCAPRFDSPAMFCSILDRRRGGSFLVAPAEVRASRQWYEEGTGVLHTELHGPDGVVQVTDALTLRRGADLCEDAPAARGELVRSARVLGGRVSLDVRLEPRGGAAVERAAGGLRVIWPLEELDLHLTSSRELGGLTSVHHLEAGERLDLVLSWAGGSHRYRTPPAGDLIDTTVDAWRRWAGAIDYAGPAKAQVRRSAITLKMLDHFETGAIVAAPTSSLPEAIGGPRNWDYRYVWVRDAAFSVYALGRIGMQSEARGFLGWVLDSVERAQRAAVLYDLDGHVPEGELEDGELEGYRGSSPVRWGNGAAGQQQNDAYGEIIDCAYQFDAPGDGAMLPWERLRPLIDTAAKVWREPDHGIWEVRTEGRVFTYSAAMCQVALHRGAAMARRHGLPGDVEHWEREAATISAAILEQGWDESRRSLTEHLGGGGLDASLLTLPLRRVVPADHPRMTATVEAVARELGAGEGLLYRYLPDESPDGLEGHEGAFLLCSFWLVDNLAMQGRLDEAQELFSSLCARGGHLGLLPEQIDPGSGAFLGNYPQAFSHVGVVSSAVNLAQATEARS